MSEKESSLLLNERLDFINRLRSKKEREEGALLEGSSKRIFQAERAHRLVHFFLKEFSVLLSNQLKTEVRFALDIRQEVFFRKLSESGFVQVELLTGIHKLSLLVPHVLLQEVSARVLEEKTQPTLRNPNDEDLTALSFMIARVLGTEEAFSGQQIFLTSVRFVREEKIFKGNPDRKMFFIQVSFEKSAYPLGVFGEKEWFRSIEALSQKVFFPDSADRRLRGALTKWKLRFSLEPKSIGVLAGMSVGDRWKVNDWRWGEEKQSIRCQMFQALEEQPSLFLADVLGKVSFLSEEKKIHLNLLNKER